jgi:hypothetical protein
MTFGFLVANRATSVPSPLPLGLHRPPPGTSYDHAVVWTPLIETLKRWVSSGLAASAAGTAASSATVPSSVAAHQWGARIVIGIPSFRSCYRAAQAPGRMFWLSAKTLCGSQRCLTATSRP